MNVQLVSYTPGSERLIAYAGKVCVGQWASDWAWKSDMSTIRAYIKKRIQEGHLSLVEHATATFLITGVSRTMLQQIVTHRIASFSRESQRYTDQRNGSTVVPDTIQSNPDAMDVFQDIVARSREAYVALREMGIPKQDARFVLPEGSTTSLIMTANFREWRHVITLRCSKHAQWEIRNVMGEILTELYSIAPSVFEDLYLERGDECL